MQLGTIEVIISYPPSNRGTNKLTSYLIGSHVVLSEDTFPQGRYCYRYGACSPEQQLRLGKYLEILDKFHFI
jgi:hypothetical protein